jgi:hypothetical protein
MLAIDVKMLWPFRFLPESLPMPRKIRACARGRHIEQFSVA